MESFISRQSVSHLGGERQSEYSSHTTQSPRPQPLSPSRTYDRDSGTPDSSITPSSLDSFQRLALTPSRSLDCQHAVLMPLDLSPRQRPVLASSDLSPFQRSESSRVTGFGTSSLAWNQQITRTPTVRLWPKQHLGQIHSEKISNVGQAHPLSRGLPAFSSPCQHNVRVTHSTPSIPPTLGRPSGGHLNQRLAAISPKYSRLTQDRKFCSKVFIFYLTLSFIRRILRSSF